MAGGEAEVELRGKGKKSHLTRVWDGILYKVLSVSVPFATTFLTQDCSFFKKKDTDNIFILFILFFSAPRGGRGSSAPYSGYPFRPTLFLTQKTFF